MAFQPFGYRFDIRSSQSPDRVRADIRSRWKGWFDPRSGARGWIIGPFICLWFSALNRFGPMLLGRIDHDGFATRISGRAGSDLNGVLWVCFMVGLLTVGLVTAVVRDGYHHEVVLVCVLLIGLMAMALWFGHADRKQAEPLVRFLKATAGVHDPMSSSFIDDLALPAGLRMSVNDQIAEGSLTTGRLRDALLDVGEDDVLILEWTETTYIQTLSRNGGFILEKRSGSEHTHMRATRAATDGDRFKDFLSFEETLAALAAYAAGAPTVDAIRWERLHLGSRASRYVR